MKPYNLKWDDGFGKHSIWVDLDHILEIIEPSHNINQGYVRFAYIMMFRDDYREIKNTYNEWKKEFVIEEFNNLYEKFLDAWKNKDIIRKDKT